MTTQKRIIEIVQSGSIHIEVFSDGSAPAIVVIPSYGRDSGDRFTKAVADAAFLVLRPKPSVAAARAFVHYDGSVVTRT